MGRSRADFMDTRRLPIADVRCRIINANANGYFNFSSIKLRKISAVKAIFCEIVNKKKKKIQILIYYKIKDLYKN